MEGEGKIRILWGGSLMENKQSDNQLAILRQLFISTLILSAFTFGGGYVIITLMRKTFVDDLGWIDKDEMLDLVAIAQSAPGAIAVNGAIVIGYKLAGLAGVLTAVVATIIPPFTIITLISFFYEAFRSNVWIALLLEGMQAGVAAVIVSVVLQMGKEITDSKNPWLIAGMFIAFVANFVFNVNVVLIILTAAAIGLVSFLFIRNKGGKEA
jgi:chromate transporter